MAKTNLKAVSRAKRVKRIRKKISGTAERPRLRVFKSAKHIYAQLIDDVAGNTLVSSSTMDKEMQGQSSKGKTDIAHEVGKKLAERAKQKGYEQIIFDRGGYIYHGRVKALSEGAREGGLKF